METPFNFYVRMYMCVCACILYIFVDMFVDGDLCFRNNLYKIRDRIIFIEFRVFRVLKYSFNDRLFRRCIYIFFFNLVMH